MRRSTGAETHDVALYVADMAAQLETMAQAAGLDLVAYFLSMARIECDGHVRAKPSADEPASSVDEREDDQPPIV